MQVRVDQLKDGGVPCGCGRNPGGKCMGWHALSEDDWAGQKIQLQHNLRSNYNEKTYKIVGEDSGEV